MCTTSEHSPPEARITPRVLLPMMSTAASFRMPHSFALENFSSRVVQCGLSVAKDHVFTPSQLFRNYYQYGVIGSKVREKVFVVCYHAATEPAYYWFDSRSERDGGSTTC